MNKIIDAKIELTSGFIYDNLADNALREERNFHIVIHYLSTFLEGSRYFFSINRLFKSDNYDNYLPVIHISLIDFLDDEDKNLKNTVPNLPRYKNVIDSGVWNYYVPYHKKGEKDFATRLNETIAEITNNKNFGLYECRNAKEIVEFKGRILQQSYIDPRGGHGNLVAPFLFHSESKMKKMAECEFSKLPQNLSWRFLLIDDHATEKHANAEKNCISKCKIIKNILRKYGFVCKCANKEQNAETFARQNDI